MTRMGPRGFDSGRWTQPIGPCHVRRRPRLGGGLLKANQRDVESDWRAVAGGARDLGMRPDAGR
jgi:hypothetical protein